MLINPGKYIVYEGKYKGMYASYKDKDFEIFTISFSDTNKFKLFSKPNIISVDINEISEMEFSLYDKQIDEFGYKIENANGDFSYLEPFEKVTKETRSKYGPLDEANLIIITWKDGEKSYIGVDFNSVDDLDRTHMLHAYMVDLFGFARSWYCWYLDFKK